MEQGRDLLEQTVMGKGKTEWETSELVALLSKLQPAVGQVKQAPVAAIPLELVLVEWCVVEKTEAQKKFANDKNVFEDKNKQNHGLTENGQSASTQRPEDTTQTLKETQQKAVTSKKKPHDQEKTQQLAFDKVLSQWGQIMKEVKPLNHSIEALLRSARPAHTKGQWLTIEVFYTFHKEQLEQERHRKIVEGVIGEVMNVPVKVTYVLGKRASTAEKKVSTKVQNVTGMVDDEELARAAEEIFS